MKVEINIKKTHFIALSALVIILIFSISASFITAAAPLGAAWHHLSGISGDGGLTSIDNGTGYIRNDTLEQIPLTGISSDGGLTSIDNGTGYIRADVIESSGSSGGGKVIQHAEDGDALNNARLYVNLDSVPSTAKLTVLAEHSRSMGGDPVDFPAGVVLANVLSSTETSPTYSAADDDGWGTYFSKRDHTHIFKYIYNHKHKNGIYKEAGGKLPTNAQIYINGVDRTAAITWTTQNPVAEKDKMIDEYDISSYLAAGDNWIEIGSNQAFKARFYLEMS